PQRRACRRPLRLARPATRGARGRGHFRAPKIPGLPLHRTAGDRMSHPITELQAMLVAALRAGDLPVFDAPPAGATPPYLAIARHDMVPRDADAAPGHEHRVAIHCWAGTPSRKAALALAEHVLAVGLGDLSGP